MGDLFKVLLILYSASNLTFASRLTDDLDPNAIWVTSDLVGTKCPKVLFPVYFQDPKGDNFFIRCFMGFAYEYRCPEPQVFDFETNRCSKADADKEIDFREYYDDGIETPLSENDIFRNAENRLTFDDSLYSLGQNKQPPLDNVKIVENNDIPYLYDGDDDIFSNKDSEYNENNIGLNDLSSDVWRSLLEDEKILTSDDSPNMIGNSEQDRLSDDWMKIEEDSQNNEKMNLQYENRDASIKNNETPDDSRVTSLSNPMGSSNSWDDIFARSDEEDVVLDSKNIGGKRSNIFRGPWLGYPGLALDESSRVMNEDDSLQGDDSKSNLGLSWDNILENGKRKISASESKYSSSEKVVDWGDIFGSINSNDKSLEAQGGTEDELVKAFLTISRDNKMMQPDLKPRRGEYIQSVKSYLEDESSENSEESDRAFYDDDDTYEASFESEPDNYFDANDILSKAKNTAGMKDGQINGGNPKTYEIPFSPYFRNKVAPQDESPNGNVQINIMMNVVISENDLEETQSWLMVAASALQIWTTTVSKAFLQLLGC